MRPAPVPSRRFTFPWPHFAAAKVFGALAKWSPSIETLQNSVRILTRILCGLILELVDGDGGRKSALADRIRRSQPHKSELVS
jgi:hypothetical protein